MYIATGMCLSISKWSPPSVVGTPIRAVSLGTPLFHFLLALHMGGGKRRGKGRGRKINVTLSVICHGFIGTYRL